MVDFAKILVALFILTIGVVYAWYASTVIRNKPVTGVESLVGAKGVVYSDLLSQKGEVSINGVIWRARMVDPTAGTMKKGDGIVVNRVEDLTLVVDPVPLLKQGNS
jgi:membrane protein implicated in regulation of membrane protease activity